MKFILTEDASKKIEYVLVVDFTLAGELDSLNDYDDASEIVSNIYTDYSRDFEKEVESALIKVIPFALPTDMKFEASYTSADLYDWQGRESFELKGTGYAYFYAFREMTEEERNAISQKLKDELEPAHKFGAPTKGITIPFDYEYTVGYTPAVTNAPVEDCCPEEYEMADASGELFFYVDKVTLETEEDQ